MFGLSYPAVAGVFIVIWIAYRIIVHRKNRKITFTREALLNAFFIYFLAVILYTLFKRGYLDLSFENYSRINFIPIREIVKTFLDGRVPIKNPLLNLFGNILLFMPLGFSIPLLFSKCRRVTKAALYGFWASVAIETLQYFTASNITDIDDVILNTIGTVLGFLFYRVFYEIFKNTRLNALLEKAADAESTRLIPMAAKPLSIMLLASMVLVLQVFYGATYSPKLSNDAMAKEVFSAYGKTGNAEFVLSRDFDKYKFFLKDNEKYLELSSLKRVFANRYATSNMDQINWKDSKFGYGLHIFGNYRYRTLGVVVFGRNSSAKSVVITFMGKEYREELIPGGYFIVPHPSIEKVLETTDIYNIPQNKPSKDLQIKFLDELGNECKDMVFVR